MSLSGEAHQTTIEIEVPTLVREAAQLLLVAALHGTEDEIEEYLVRYRLACGWMRRSTLGEVAEDLGISQKTLWTRRNKHDLSRPKANAL